MQHDSNWLSGERQSLEDAFFAKQDALLITKLKKLQELEESKKTISESSGITNPAILEKLVELEIRPETAAMLTLVPLIEMAWADGHISPKEKTTILAMIEKAHQGQVDMDILERWLSHKPEPRLLTAWTHYVQGLCEKLSDQEIDLLRNGLIQRGRTIAEAAGGFLGVGKISQPEKDMLKKLESAFVLGSGR